MKDRAVAQMKADGVEYDQRMEELEKLEYPKPLRDFVYDTFNAFADRHPWVGEENIRPKSIAREMFENFRSFAEYVHEYDLERSEGLLLRHLNSVYKVLSQTVPDGAKTDDGARDGAVPARRCCGRSTRASLDEWERMRDPSYIAPASAEPRPPGQEGPPDITNDAKAFTAAIRVGSSRSCAPGRSATTRPRSRSSRHRRTATASPWDAARLKALRESTAWSTARSASIRRRATCGTRR